MPTGYEQQTATNPYLGIRMDNATTSGEYLYYTTQLDPNNWGDTAIGTTDTTDNDIKITYPGGEIYLRHEIETLKARMSQLEAENMALRLQIKTQIRNPFADVERQIDKLLGR